MAKNFSSEIPTNSIVVVVNRNDRLTYTATTLSTPKKLEKFLKVVYREQQSKLGEINAKS